MDSPRALRLVLIGKTGVGKSKTGNTILNGKNHFLSSSQGSSMTDVCKLRDEVVFGRSVSAVDTPGLLDTNKEESEVLYEITRCIYMSAPGPHAIILVVQIGRFTAEDVYTVEQFVKHFGEELFRYIIILFTRYDDYKRDMADRGTSQFSIHTYIQSLPDKVKDFINVKCCSRVVGFDNTLRGKDSEDQVVELFAAIDSVVRQNGNRCYTNEDYRKAEEKVREQMQQEEERLQKKLQEEKEKHQKELEAATEERVKVRMNEEHEKRRKDMIERMTVENLRREAQQNPSFFEQVTNALSSVLELGLRGYKMYLTHQM